jgi:hypothetical protein
LEKKIQGKNCPLIWAKFLPNKIGCGIVWAIFVVIGRFFTKTSGHPDFG